MLRPGQQNATAEEEALFWRLQARRQARVQARRSALSRSLVPSRVVREEAAPVMLFGYDQSMDEEDKEAVEGVRDEVWEIIDANPGTQLAVIMGAAYWRLADALTALDEGDQGRAAEHIMAAIAEIQRAIDQRLLGAAEGGALIQQLKDAIRGSVFAFGFVGARVGGMIGNPTMP